MKWVQRAREKLRWHPKPAERAQLWEIEKRKTVSIQTLQQAYVQLEAAEVQAKILRAMDESNHYSESLTQAMQGRRFT